MPSLPKAMRSPEGENPLASMTRPDTGDTPRLVTQPVIISVSPSTAWPTSERARTGSGAAARAAWDKKTATIVTITRRAHRHLIDHDTPLLLVTAAGCRWFPDVPQDPRHGGCRWSLRAGSTLMRAWRVRTIVFCCALGLTVQSAARSAAAPSSRLAVTTVDRGAMWVAVVNADGSGLRRLTAAPGHSVTPVWAPDGRRLAYTHIEGSESQIYLINTDGTGRRRFTGSPGVALLPAWSPDGTRIAFVRRLGSASRIVVANVDRPGETALTPEGAPGPVRHEC
ncbi:MAG: hypothetical protein E6H01_03340 [Bacillati bacterium ANGP1]|uniref:Dipeptidylpeptidase IV N-terminal domain-containing protein n=1 Tax=Candidatus Segetimicrobium genomatis TaxID=2569760 RepID=A0A537LBF5_9BACT|nr:MAG: hypothetical protein E6H01_03340 [Terrabacteria group bacterium ANGP1]